jgi:hypothetical protein
MALAAAWFASDLMHTPLKVLCELGGWKAHDTVLECYRRPDAEVLRTALAQWRRRACNVGNRQREFPPAII